MTNATHAADLLPLIVATGLPGSLLPGVEAPVPDSEFAQLLDTVAGVEASRTSGLLVEAIATGVLPATAVQEEMAANLHGGALVQAAEVRSLLARIHERLDASGARTLVIDDLVAAHVDYARPELRPYRDLHLLADPSDPTVEQVLLELGMERAGRHVRADFASRFSDSIWYRRRGQPDVFVHRSLVDGPSGVRIDNATLLRAVIPVTIDGHRLFTLRPELRLLHACLGAVLGRDRPWIALRDIAVLALYGDLNARWLRGVAEEWGCQASVALAVDEAWRRLGLADVLALSWWAGRYEPSRHERRVIHLHQSPGRYVRRGLATMHALPGVRPKLAFAWALGVPETQFLEAAGISRSRWVVHGLHQVLSRKTRGDDDPQS